MHKNGCEFRPGFIVLFFLIPSPFFKSTNYEEVYSLVTPLPSKTPPNNLLHLHLTTSKPTTHHITTQHTMEPTNTQRTHPKARLNPFSNTIKSPESKIEKKNPNPFFQTYVDYPSTRKTSFHSIPLITCPNHPSNAQPSKYRHGFTI